jgi:hypothetical protein
MVLRHANHVHLEPFQGLRASIRHAPASARRGSTQMPEPRSARYVPKAVTLKTRAAASTIVPAQKVMRQN